MQNGELPVRRKIVLFWVFPWLGKQLNPLSRSLFVSLGSGVLLGLDEEVETGCEARLGCSEGDGDWSGANQVLVVVVVVVVMCRFANGTNRERYRIVQP